MLVHPVLLALLVAAVGVPSVLGKTTVVTVATSPSPRAEAIPPNFVGFSTENEPTGVKEMLSAGFHAALANLYKTTNGSHPGPVIRVGGNSADDWCFHSTKNVHPPPANCSGTFNETTIQQQLRFAKLADKIQVRFVIDVNFGLSPDPSHVAVPHVEALTAAGLWPWIKAVEIGNEMDLYATHSVIPGKPHHRDPAYNFDRYATEFGVFEAAFKQAGMPARGVQGGTWASSRWYNHTTEYLTQFNNTMKSFSLHKYARTSCGGAKPVTLAALLSYIAAEGSFSQEWDQAAVASQQASIPFVIGEGNSISCGGTTGVSDTAAAALWVLDFLPWASKHGADGMQFHGGPHGPYAAVSFDGALPGVPTLHPLYYGLLVFSELVANYSRWLSTSIHPRETSHSDPQCAYGIQSGSACCAASCGSCGGGTCAKQPGGANGCCTGAITRTNRSCNLHPAPCLLDEDWGPHLVAHSTIDTQDNIKVLLVTKNISQVESESVSLCFNSSRSWFAGQSDQFATATVAMLRTPKGASTKVGDGMTWAGQTFDGTTDGSPLGTRSVTTVTPYPSPGAGQICFNLSIPPLSAALVTVRATQFGD